MSSRAEREYMASAGRKDANHNNSGRTIPLKVICPGLSRSGTGAMRQALEILGIGRTFHGLRLGERPDDLNLWIDLTDRKYPPNGQRAIEKPITAPDLDKVIGDCGAVTDMPCAAFWRELMEAYPKAKVVLVERDLESWYRSFDQAVIQGLMSMKGQILANHWVAGSIGYRNPEVLHRLFLNYFRARNKQELAAKARQIYLEHNEAVQAACSQQGRPLLDYKLGSGWHTLCEFLEVDVPKDVDFPRGNEAEVLLPFIHKAQRELLIRAIIKLLRHAAVGTIVSTVAWTIWTQPQMFRRWLD